MSDIDASKIDVGWRVQLDATAFNDHCKYLHGIWGTVTFAGDREITVTDHLKGMKRYIKRLPTSFLAALPPEPVKDPFAVGDWVVCVRKGVTTPANPGDIIQVTGSHWSDPDWFADGDWGYAKHNFRPATPEEIAAHLGTTTPTNTILDRAKSIITGSRQTTNGKPERSFHKIAERWSLTLGTTVTAQQVALMMVDLKMVRALEGVTTEGHDDHFVDMAGYVALAAELGE